MYDVVFQNRKSWFLGNIVVVVNGLTYFEEQWQGDDKKIDSRNNFEKISHDIAINMKNVLPKTEVLRYQYVLFFYLFFCILTNKAIYGISHRVNVYFEVPIYFFLSK